MIDGMSGLFGPRRIAKRMNVINERVERVGGCFGAGRADDKIDVSSSDRHQCRGQLQTSERDVKSGDAVKGGLKQSAPDLVLDT